jgi:hypothetical protein
VKSSIENEKTKSAMYLFCFQKRYPKRKTRERGIACTAPAKTDIEIKGPPVVGYRQRQEVLIMPSQKEKHLTPQNIIREIVRMHNEDRVTIRELSNLYKMPYKSIRNMVTRENNKKRLLEAGIEPLRRGRPSKKPKSIESQKDDEIKRLKMENDLMRDFLRVYGRM